MTTRLIELADGTLVEITVLGDGVQEISGRLAERVNSTTDRILPVLVNACRPVAAAWRELNKEMVIKEAEIEFGLSFEGEGNVYITRAMAGANLVVKITLKESDGKGQQE